MSQIPPASQPPMQPYAQPGLETGRHRTSASAIISLVCGLAGCIPFVTSLLALIFGIVGIRATSNPSVRGRGLAIAGLILGIIGLVLWSVFGTAGIGLYLASRAPAQTGRQFVLDVAAGNVQAAMSNADASLPQANVQALVDQAKPWGTSSNVTFAGRNVTTNGNVTTWTLTGIMNFTTGGTKTIVVDLKKQADGSYKVSRAAFQP